MEKIIHPRAVKFDHFGGVDVLDVVEVDRPLPGTGQVLVRIRELEQDHTHGKIVLVP